MVDCQLLFGEAKRFHRISSYMWNLVRQQNYYISAYTPIGGEDEYWAEAVTVWVLGPAYQVSGVPPDINERDYISDIYGWVEEVLNP